MLPMSLELIYLYSERILPKLKILFKQWPEFPETLTFFINGNTFQYQKLWRS